MTTLRKKNIWVDATYDPEVDAILEEDFKQLKESSEIGSNGISLNKIGSVLMGLVVLIIGVSMYLL